MAKGNRSDSKRETSHLIANSERYKAELDSYKAYAEARRNSRKYTQPFINTLIDRGTNYFKEREEANKPYTVAGLILALGIPQGTYFDMKEGMYDYLLVEYIDTNNITIVEENNETILVNEDGSINNTAYIEYSELLKKFDLMIQADREERCLMSSKHNPAGSIFLLKSQQGLKEDEPKQVTQNLIISDKDRARDIIKLLE